ncbi:TPA: RNA helicase, partial [Escherichia coli]|nr:RNA helicase [Escherichia coli]
MLDEVTISIGFKESRIVSTGLDVSTIHKRIVNNIYNDDIIICDVSSRNPNVMFELGMRIAFDKPVVIIKDNATQYCFDSGTIEHLEYPKDMRYSEIEKFKALLKQKIEN